MHGARGVEPLLAGVLLVVALVTDAIREDLGAAARARSEPRLDELGEDLREGFFARRAICISSIIVKAFTWIEGRSAFTARMMSR